MPIYVSIEKAHDRYIKTKCSLEMTEIRDFKQLPLSKLCRQVSE